MTLRTWSRIPAVAAIVALTIVVAGCMGSQTSATPTGAPFTGSPTAAPGVMVGEEQVNIDVSNGEFDTREIRLVENVATTLNVTNTSDQTYYLRIGNLVVGEEIAAGGVTPVSFTTPTDDEYEAELLDGPDGNVLDTVLVNVVQPGG